MSAFNENYVPDWMHNGCYDVEHGYKGTIAAVTSIEAARAVVRLYQMAFQRGERPMTSVAIARQARGWMYHSAVEDQPRLTNGYYNDMDEWERAEAESEAAAMRMRREGYQA